MNIEQLMPTEPILTMRLGVSYNIFDGEEMLVNSIKNLRPIVDHINVVYQDISNYNQKNDNIEEFVKRLLDEKLIDIAYRYIPKMEHINADGSVNWKNGQFNEIEKRNIGLNICRANLCNTMLTIDCDELYDHTQFEWAKKDFWDGGYDTSFSKMSTYYKKPTYQLNPKEEYYAPLFYKIYGDTKFGYESDNYPVLIDPTRKVKAGYARIYDREEIEMHHFAYVRNNIETKVRNSSSQMDSYSQDEVIRHYNQFDDISKGALLLGNQTFGLIEVENKFNIEL